MATNKLNIKKLEAKLWEAADELRANSKLTSSQYCMPTLALLFLRYAYNRFLKVKADIDASRPHRPGREIPVTELDFKAKNALFLPEQARFDYIVNLPDDVASMNLKSIDGEDMTTLGQIINNAMRLVEAQSEQLKGILPKEYTKLPDDLLRNIIRIFNDEDLKGVGGDVMGRIYEYFLSKFAKAVASDDGVFFTPKSLVKMLVNVLEPTRGTLLDPACGSGGMFIQSGDFIHDEGSDANTQITFFGQEKVEYNAQLCQMNLAVHGLNGKIISGDNANSFYNDHWNLDGKCDYVMANPPFNVNKVNATNAQMAGRLPFGLPGYNDKTQEIGNANYLWISYFYSYLNKHGRAGFVMASSATDSANKDKLIREKLVETGHVDVMVSVGNNFFYTLSLPCSLWFFDKGKADNLRDKVLFIDARNYYTVVDRTLNEWTEWQLKNLKAIVNLYRGETEKYKDLLDEYWQVVCDYKEEHDCYAWYDDSISNGGPYPFKEVLGPIYGYKAGYELNIKKTTEELKTAKRSEKADLKEFIALNQESLDKTLEVESIVKEAIWLVEKFGIDGTYQDIAGLCKIATLDEIREKNYSLTPGAYVGVAEVEDDGVDFHERMNEIHSELTSLNKEANLLMSEILKEWEGMK